MAYDPASLDKPFEILKAFDWGGDTSAFQPIDSAVVVAHVMESLRMCDLNTLACRSTSLAVIFSEPRQCLSVFLPTIILTSAAPVAV